MTWRDRALAAIHVEFTVRREQNPGATVAEIFKEIRPIAARRFGNSHPTKTWRAACDDYERDAKKMYEQN